MVRAAARHNLVSSGVSRTAIDEPGQQVVEVVENTQRSAERAFTAAPGEVVELELTLA